MVFGLLLCSDLLTCLCDLMLLLGYLLGPSFFLVLCSEAYISPFLSVLPGSLFSTLVQVAGLLLLRAY